MSHHRIEARDLTFAYPDGHPAIRSLSFVIRHGESVGIIGANGAGKSTLLLLLLGLLQPSGGEILIGDVRITPGTATEVRRHLGLVFQDPDDQLFMTSVYDDVAFGPRNRHLDDAAVDRRVQAALATVGITHLAGRAPYQLSGGEKRAASIATVLAMQPDVLIMDEPTAGLDPRSRRRVIDFLQGFAHTKMITAHDLDLIQATCRRTIILLDGAIAADGLSDDLLTDAALLDRCGLEVPPALRACPHCGRAPHPFIQ
jgi:cobalt/nickel transport system ATP-binding protein